MPNSTFNNSPSIKGKGRILRDSQMIKRDQEKLAKEGLYFDFKITNEIFSTYYSMLIVGPEDSPYVGGFYLFEAQFSDQYPYKPMKLKTLTQGGNIRKHPNLYRNGKCCFSFLGTWHGPPWSACQNPQSVGFSIRSVLTNNPITNEPGWEKKNDTNTKLYEDLVRYFNIKYAVIEIVKKRPVMYDIFKTQITENFLKHYQIYKKQVESLKHLDGKTLDSPVYSFSVTINCNELNQELDKLYYKLNPNAKPVTIHNSSNSKKYIRKAPEKKASNYETGTITTGLDGKQWIVKEYLSGRKRWIHK